MLLFIGSLGGRVNRGDVMSRVARRLQEEHGDAEGTLQANTAAAVRASARRRMRISYVIAASEDRAPAA
jgi:hypothetical protein